MAIASTALACRSGTEPASSATLHPVVAALPAFPILGLAFAATCEIEDHGYSMYPVTLRARGRAFVTLTPDRTRVRANAGRAAAVVTSYGLTLFGDLDIKDLRVSPRDPLPVVSWLEISEAGGDRVEHDELVLRPRFPSYLHVPDVSAARMPCRSVRLAPIGSRSTFYSNQIGVETLTSGQTLALAISPGGRTVATIATPNTGLLTTILGRQPGYEKVRIDNELASVIGWVTTPRYREPETAPSPYTKWVSRDPQGRSFGDTAATRSFSNAVWNEQQSRLRCDHDVPVYVRIDGELLRVGTASSGYHLPSKADAAGDIPFPEFGESLRPLIRASDVRHCVSAAPTSCG